MPASTRTPLALGLILLLGVSAGAFGQQRGSKLFPDVFDDNWKPPTPQPDPASTRPTQPQPVPPQTVPPQPQPQATPQPVPQPAVNVPAPTVPLAPAKLLDVPPADKLLASRKLMREVFAAQLADQTPGGRQKLLDALRREADRMADNVVDRYVLLAASLQAARDVGDLPALVGVADQLGGAYNVDAVAIKADIAGRTVPKSDPATAEENVRAALGLVDELVARDDFAAATRVLQAVQPAANASPASRTLHVQRGKDLVAIKSAFDRTSLAQAKLAASPNDAASLLTVGSYTCFVRGDWARGLPMLANGSNPLVRAAAAADLLSGDGPGVEAVGDAWWDAAEREPVVRFQQAMRARARARYEVVLASGTASGLVRVKLERRISEAGAAEPSVPLLGTTFKVPAGNQWVQTSFSLVEGKCYEIVARGKWTDSTGAATGPGGSVPEAARNVFNIRTGVPKEARDQAFVGQAPRGALIARVEKGKPGFLVGDRQTFIAPASFPLELRMNDGDEVSPQRRGQLDVAVREVTPRFADARGETRIAARLDAADTLHLTNEGLYWVYGGSWAKVGQHEGYYPTTINGILWWPKWTSKERTAPLAGTGLVPKTKLVLVKVEASRGDVSVESAGPGEAALKFSDKGGGSSVVGCVISFGAAAPK